MSHSIGKVIRKLRIERNYTQEELAEQLNISSQAVSKWENETSMPDISQIVPLASVFGISTDVLFGTYGTNDEEEVQKILESAYRLNENNEVDLKKRYAELQNGLKKYPNNIWLLFNCLESGNALCYHSGYDAQHGEEIYPECIRMANLVINYSKEVNDVLRARMIIVILHSAYGNINKAWEHANNFPWRADMTIHEMSAYIAHAEKNYADEALYCQRDIMYHLESILDNIVQLGDSYRYMKRYDDAMKMFESVFGIITFFFANEKLLPPLHCRERGDVHTLIAKTYLEIGDIDKALPWLEKMCDYDINTRSQFKDDMYVDTLFLRDVKYTYYYTFGDNRVRLLNKLTNDEFACLKDNDRYKALLNMCNK